MSLVSHFYLTPASTLAQLPRKDWRRLGVSLIAQLSYADSQSLFVRPWSLQDCALAVQRIRAASGTAALYLGFMAADERGVADRSKATLGGFDLTGPFLPNVARLALAARAAGCIGMSLDCEIYPHTPNHSGGPMVPGVAWPASPNIQAHARAFRAALAGLPLLCYVWLDDLLRTRAGVPLFPGWKPWVRTVGVARLLDESYVARPFKGETWEGVPVTKGIYLTHSVARNLSRRRKSAFLWTQESPGAVWG